MRLQYANLDPHPNRRLEIISGFHGGPPELCVRIGWEAGSEALMRWAANIAWDLLDVQLIGDLEAQEEFTAAMIAAQLSD